MNPMYVCLVLSIAILAQVSCKSIQSENEEIDGVVSKDGEPVWVKQGDVQTYAEEMKNTTRRPQIGDVIGQGIQGIFQGIVRAPGEIAKGVQTIFDRLRRPTTAAPGKNSTVTLKPATTKAPAPLPTSDQDQY